MFIKLFFIIFLFSFELNASNFIKLNNDMALSRVNFDNLPYWDQENYKEAIDVFLKNCSRLMSLQRGKSIAPQINKKITKDDFYVVCKIADIIKNYNKKYLRVFFENYFLPYKVIDLNYNNSLFTGYYLPQINAKRTKDSIYRYPIYRRPYDLQPNSKYYTRREINNGVLNNKNLEILYTNDFVDLFFFHIQGSGSVFLVDENKTISIGYDGKNNHKFTSIGQYMLANRLIKSGNSKDIKEELKKKDINLVKSILNKNESYIFFKIIDGENITGAFGSELIPFRTMAVDKKYIPLGFPLWVSTKHNTKYDNYYFNKLVIANDTGSAIKGVVRGDIFFGSGIEGENNASYQYSSGDYYLLLPERVFKKLNK